ncbi:DUF6056 family protein [Prevotella sp. 10(H)]|uniref:DUF3329 domain-containing protein n=1 Tax=Prevotella sp. 10(H) TaxID=1158294 RepID=UPI0004A78079|nr:DUF6056 family protein [Prevotella sp. 10(H)]
MSVLPFKKLNAANAPAYILAAIIITITGFIFLYNYLYPAVEDDWFYAFIWKANVADMDGSRITNLHDLFESQYAHYMQWGGRTVAHVIAQTLLNIDMIWQDILNTLVYISLMFLMYKYSIVGKKTNVLVFLLICTIFWLFQPMFASTMFWITGSANYMWCTLIILLFVYPFHVLYMKENGKENLLKAAGLFVFGIIAGWTNENMVIAIIFCILVLIFLMKRQNIFIPKWVYWGLAGFIIGSLFLLLSPGNAVRYEKELDAESASASLFSIETIIARLQHIWFYYRRYLLTFSITSLVAIIYYYIKGKNKKPDKFTSILLLLFISAHIALFAMIASPTFPERALFGLICLFIILIGLAFANLSMDNKWVRSVSILVIVVATVASCVDYAQKYKVVREIDRVDKEREEIIEKGKKLGLKDFVFDNQLVVSQRFHYHEWPNDQKDGKTIVFCLYHGINSAIIIDRWGKDSTEINPKYLEMKARQDSILNSAK